MVYFSRTCIVLSLHDDMIYLQVWVRFDLHQHRKVSEVVTFADWVGFVWSSSIHVTPFGRPYARAIYAPKDVVKVSHN